MKRQGDDGHDRGSLAPPGPLRVRVGDREIWLVPAAAIERWSAGHAAWMLRDAAGAWPLAASLRALGETMLAPPSAGLPWLLDALERERALVIRLPLQGDGVPRSGDATLDDDDDDAPRLASLSDAARDARTRRDGGRGTAEPPAGTEPVAKAFVAFRVIDQDGRPLSGTWRSAPLGAGTLDGSTVRVDVPVDSEAMPLQLQVTRRGDGGNGPGTGAGKGAAADPSARRGEPDDAVPDSAGPNMGGDTSEPRRDDAPGGAAAERSVTEVVLDGWAQGSVVMRWGGMRARVPDCVATARGALRIALEAGVGRCLCVAGHADPVGSDANNHTISLERARSVQLFASGELVGWAGHAFANASPTDLACALVASHAILGRGTISLDDDAALADALAAVRTWAGLSPRRSVDASEWLAFAQLYESDLVALMQTDPDGLAMLRREIAWAPPGFVALGERHPTPAIEIADIDGPEAPAHRRASLLIFPDAATAAEALTEDASAIYDGRFARTFVRVPPEVRVRLFVHDAALRGLSRASVLVELDGRPVREMRVDEHGMVSFTVLRGTRVRLLSARQASGSGGIIDFGTPEFGRFV
ncbi:MAG: hypothetical protein K1X88_20170 [Nannocystaceae bacterium]|nr:hypothetical protein [Nannocystaceae bacterium]